MLESLLMQLNIKKKPLWELEKNDNIQHLYQIKYKTSLGKVCKELFYFLMATYLITNTEITLKYNNTGHSL